jgi:hypothetical protein
MDATDGELAGFGFSDGALFPDDATLSHTSGSFAGRKSLSVRNRPLREETSTTRRSSGWWCAGGGDGGTKDSWTRTVMASGFLTNPRKSRSVKN